MSLYDTVMEKGYSSEPLIDEHQDEIWRIELTKALENSITLIWLKTKQTISSEDTHAKISKFETDLVKIEETLRKTYGLPHHFNLADHIGEILLIILSRKTRVCPAGGCEGVEG